MFGVKVLDRGEARGAGAGRQDRAVLGPGRGIGAQRRIPRKGRGWRQAG